MTSYLLLRRVNDGEAVAARRWEEFGVVVEAHTPEAAIRSAVLNEDKGGTFIAVPERSWKPVQVSVKQERRVSLAPATTEKPA